MNTSTIDTRRTPAKRLGIVLLGAAVALVGTLAFSGNQAKAAPFTMEFTQSRINLGFVFTGGTTKYLPAPSALPGSVSNPSFDPATWSPTSTTNQPTVFSETATPLPDYNQLDQSTFTRPGQAGVPLNDFKPIGCGTAVSFGIYYAVPYGKTANPADPTSIIFNPAAGNPFGKLLGQALPNSGIPGAPDYWRVLSKGAILKEGDPSVTFTNPFNPALPDVTLTAPYPAADTLWQPYAAGATGTPVGKTGSSAFGGAAGLRAVPNSLGFCGNPSKATVTGDVGVGGNVVVAPDDFQFPISVLDVTSVAAGTYAPATLVAEENLIGKFDSVTGALTLSGRMSARVLLGLQYDPLGSYCNVNLGEMTLTTGPSEPKASGFMGIPFNGTGGLSGPGALTGTWDVTASDVTAEGTASATSTDPPDCSRTATLGSGPGGVWLSTSEVDPPAYPDPSYGLKMKVNKKKVNRGGSVMVTVTGSNSGIVSGDGTVSLKSSNKKRGTVAKSVNLGTLEAGGSRSKTVKVKIKKAKKAKGKLTITGKLGGKTAKVTVTVK